MKDIEEVLFGLVSFGLGKDLASVSVKDVNWELVYNMASQQGLVAICMDGLQRLSQHSESFGSLVDKPIKLQWIASVIKQEQTYNAQFCAAKSLADIYGKFGILTYVMKGFTLSRLYPRPEHRPCTDMDCFLVHDGDNAYEYGNRIARENGLRVDSGYYKHSKIFPKGLTVENHRYLLPVKGSRKAKKFEQQLRSWIDDGSNEYIGDSKLKATSPFFDAVFVLAHAQEHFLNEGIVLRHICDWAMVLKVYASKVDWNEWKMACQEYGLLSFGYAMSRLANKVCGMTVPFDCPFDDEVDKRLLDDILCRKERASGRTAFQTRMDLVRGMFRNRWKYKMFSDTNALMFCTRRVCGYLFDKDLD